MANLYRSLVVLLKDEMEEKQLNKLINDILGFDEVAGLSIEKDSIDEILANDRKIVDELTKCIGEHVPMKHWPEFVGRYYAALMDKALGFSEEDDDDTDSKEVEMTSVHMRQGINWDEQPLGEISDNELSKRLGVSNVAVGKARRRRKIPPFNSKGRHRSQGQRAGINWDEQPLGQKPDADIAQRLGVDPSSVRAARRKKGIAAYPKQDRSLRISRIKAPKPLKDERGLRVRQKGETELDSAEYSMPKGPHVHRCPTCRQDTPCETKSCEPVLDNEDGVPMIYTTCQNCVTELAKERNDGMVTIGGSSSSSRFGPMSRF
jgi:hypothetical protein